MQHLQNMNLDMPELKTVRIPEPSFEDQDHKEILRVLNHDLKAGLRALAELPIWINEDMQEHGLTVPRDVREHLDMMQRSANDMLGLLDGLIGLSNAGRAPDEPSRVTVEQAARRAWADLADTSEFKLHVSDALDTLYLPRKAVQSIFKAVLENALHHHDRRTGQIHVASETEGDRVLITIEDDGPGIPLEARENVFDCLVMLRRREETGRAGLGLTLARKLVTRLGGTITATTASNQRGTAVLINLPMRARL